MGGLVPQPQASVLGATVQTAARVCVDVPGFSAPALASAPADPGLSAFHAHLALARRLSLLLPPWWGLCFLPSPLKGSCLL